MDDDAGVETFLNSLCGAAPQLRDQERIKSDIVKATEAMMLIGMHVAVSGVLARQREVVGEFSGAISRLGLAKASIQWGTTGAALMTPGILGSLASIAVGRVAEGAVGRHLASGKDTATGPQGLLERLEAHQAAEVAKLGEDAEATFGLLDKLDELAQLIHHHASSCGLDVFSDGAFAYQQALGKLESRLEAGRNDLRRGLESAVNQCNAESARSLKEAAEKTESASLAGAAALASITAAITIASKASESDSTKKDDDKKWSSNDFYS